MSSVVAILRCLVRSGGTLVFPDYSQQEAVYILEKAERSDHNKHIEVSLSQ